MELKIFQQALPATLRAAQAKRLFTSCDARTIATLSAYSGGATHVAQCSRAKSYEAPTYLMQFAVPSCIDGLVIKAIPSTNTSLCENTAREGEILRQLHEDSISVPRYFGEIADGEYQFFISQLLPGTAVSDTHVTLHTARNVATTIRLLQESLKRTRAGASILANKKDSAEYYRHKTQKFVSSSFGITLHEQDLSAFDELAYVRDRHVTLVSDRSPVNFIWDEDVLSSIDFGLVLAGTTFEDWSWFIDDPRMTDTLSPEALLTIFCEEFTADMQMETQHMRKMFYIASVFVSLKQAALMLKIKNVSWAKHYLEVAACSALNSSNTSLQSMLKRIRLAFLEQNT